MQQESISLSMTRTIDRRLYSQETIAATQSAFATRCQVQEKSIGSGRFVVTVTPNQGDRKAMCATILEFWNDALIRSCQEKLTYRGHNGTP